jgi:hypothetical protein
VFLLYIEPKKKRQGNIPTPLIRATNVVIPRAPLTRGESKWMHQTSEGSAG